MACDVQLIISKYNPETGQVEQQAVTITTEENQVDENENVTIKMISDMISKLPQDTRASIASLLSGAKSQTITQKMINEYNFVSNTTIAELVSAFSLEDLVSDYNLDLSLYDKFTIIRASEFTIGNLKLWGRVLDKDGNAKFLIKSKEGAKQFLGYLFVTKKAEELFADDSVDPEIISKSILNQLDAIRDSSQDYNSRLDVIMDYLNNRDSFNKSIKYEKSTIYLKEVLEQIVDDLVNTYSNDRKYTSLERAVKGLNTNKDKKDSNYIWRIPKTGLYNLVCLYFPNFKTMFSQDTFNELNADQLQNLLFNNTSDEGPTALFLGNPLLERAVITRVDSTIKNVAEQTKTVTETVPVEKIWESIRAAYESKENEPLEKDYKKFRKDNKDDLEIIESLINDLEITVDGHRVSAKITINKNGAKSLRVTYQHEVTKPAETKETKSYLMIKIPKGTLGEIYHFGYNTKSIFTPVEDNKALNIINGKYKGMYISQGVLPNGKIVYAISRSFVSPASYMDNYSTLEAAIKGIDQKATYDKIWDNCLMTIKTVTGIPRECHVELQNVSAGQILTVRDYTLPRIDLNSMPPSFRDLLNMTVPKFIKTIQDNLNVASQPIENLNQIETPEEAAAVLLTVLNNVRNSEDIKRLRAEKNPSTLLSYILNNLGYSDKFEEAIQKVKESPFIHYYIENYYKVPNSHYGVATLKPLPKGPNSISFNENEEMLFGTQRASKFISQTMDEAIDYFNKKYGLEIERVTPTLMKDMEPFKDNATMLSKIDSIKAFIYNGRIYINTALANSSDLYHEVAHIFLGILKVNNPSGYDSIINYYKNSRKTFYKKFKIAEKTYVGMARTDIEEEAVVDIIADQMLRDGRLNSGEEAGTPGFNADRFTEMIKQIRAEIETIEVQNSTIDNELGFEARIKILLDRDSSKLQRQRALSNLIKSKIDQREITEICK